MQLIDTFPTDRIGDLEYRIGRVLPFGATITDGGVNFSIFSKEATGCTLLLYHHGDEKPFVEIPFPEEFRIGNVYTMMVFGIQIETTEYGYRFDGIWNPAAGQYFDPAQPVLDPYAKSVSGRSVWGRLPESKAGTDFVHRGQFIREDYDWEGDKPLELPLEDLVIYEMHVRGFTQDPSSGVRHRGTYAGIVEKIPYLKSLGINCIELMPIFEFDEFEYIRQDIADGTIAKNTGPSAHRRKGKAGKNEGNELTAQDLKGLRLNYWGYSTVCFFAPKAGYAASAPFGMEADELKNLIKKLHQSGIEVILDVVFNHTAEGDQRGPSISYRGIDNRTYYLLGPEGSYYNFSGCGNTMNCNNAVVRSHILDCLRYWVSAYHIDGFRFDLASILTRDADGAPMMSPPLVEALAHDAVLGSTKLIAEAWDAGGLYQVGNFPSWNRWSEWNGKYRDCVRRFVKGDAGCAPELFQRIAGSEDLYTGRGPTVSINFVTCHDGFTMFDLVSYNEKHNEANGEGNRDGSNDNDSWNCGAEGETEDPEVLSLRMRQIRNFHTLLLTSRGIPMLLSGDEFANSQSGNNNAYCQDNEISWLNWDRLPAHQSLYDYVRTLIALRAAHPVLRAPHFDRGYNGTGYPELSFHSTSPWNHDPHAGTLTFAVLYAEDHIKYGTPSDTYIYVLINAHWEAHTFDLPIIPAGLQWHLVCRSEGSASEGSAPGGSASGGSASKGSVSGGTAYPQGQEPVLETPMQLTLGPRESAVLISASD